MSRAGMGRVECLQLGEAWEPHHTTSTVITSVSLQLHSMHAPDIQQDKYHYSCIPCMHQTFNRTQTTTSTASKPTSNQDHRDISRHGDSEKRKKDCDWKLLHTTPLTSRLWSVG
eukprot:scpid109448/ scgid29440/ 